MVDFENFEIKSIIPSAYVIGTGFLLSKDGIDKTRRKSLITRMCNRPSKLEIDHLTFKFNLSILIKRVFTRYGGYLIPDGITISEIYDSEAHSTFFTDSDRFVSYLSASYGVSLTSEELELVVFEFYLLYFSIFIKKKII